MVSASVQRLLGILALLCAPTEARSRSVTARRGPAAAAASTQQKPAQSLAASLAAEAAAVENLAEPESWRWLDGSGRPVADFSGVLDEVRATYGIRDAVEVHVGCDSAVQQGGRVVFATVICIISGSGGGGRYFYSRTIEPARNYPALQTRLLREVECSLNTAEVLKQNGIDVDTVHCDSNTDPTCKSTEHTKMLVGYIQSMGYDYLVKPQAWATFVADRHSRGLMRLRGKAAVFQP